MIYPPVSPLPDKKYPREFSSLLSDFNKKKIRFASHRGSGKLGKIPENTFSAFAYSAKKGMPVNELDIRISKDGTPIIFHGPFLQKTTSGKGRIESKNLSELLGLDWGYYTKQKAKKKEPMLSLEKYLTEFAPQCYSNLEIKRDFFDIKKGLEEKVVELTFRHRLQKHVFFSSFNFLSLWRLKKLAPDCALGFLIRPKLLYELIAKLIHRLIKPDAIHVHAKRLKQRKIEKWKAKGFYLIIWGENSVERLEQLFEWGVDLAIIDDLDIPSKVNL